MSRRRLHTWIAIGALAAVVVSPAAASATSGAVDPDRPFPSPQYLIHITGHGTTSGDVKDDALIIFNNAPDANGGIYVSDGSGGTFGYSTDSSAGPFAKPSEVCAAAAGPKLAAQGGSITSFGNAQSVDCTVFQPGGGSGGTGDSTGGATSGSSASTDSTLDDHAPACSIMGDVIDAFGDPVPDIHVHVSAGGLRLDTSTLADGSYSFAEIGDDPGGGVFDPRTDQVRVSLFSEEQSHSPQRFIVGYRQKGPILNTAPFLIPDDGDCRFDFDMRSIPASYTSKVAPITDWPAVVQIYQGIHQAWELADQLGISIGYGLPLQVDAWCDSAALGCTAKSGTFFIGSRSDGAVTVDRPYIAIPPRDSGLLSPNRPDNREYHEFGHFVLASAFNGLPDRVADINHAGYANASSSDSWSEGFAEFWSSMVNRFVVGREDAELYRWEGGVTDLSEPRQAWVQEELSVASLLVRLERLSITPAPVTPRAPRTFKVTGYTEVTDPTLGRLIVGHFLNTTAEGASFGTVAGAVFYGTGNQILDGSYGTTIPADVGSGGQGLFVLVVPKGLSYKDLSITIREGRPKKPDPAGQPFEVTLPEIWAAISNYHSVKQLSAGHVFDVDDLYQALKAAFGGRGEIVDGYDTIDQLFITSGFFDNADGNFDFDPGETVGTTAHPGYGDQEKCVKEPEFGCSLPRRPRTDYTGPPASIATVDLRGADNVQIPGAQVYAQVIYPAPDQDQSYGYTVIPDADGTVQLSVPPPTSLATVVLIGIADGHAPRVLGTIEPAKFWAQASTTAGPFLSFAATLPAGDLTIPTGTRSVSPASSADDGVGAQSVVILVAGLAIAAVGGALFGRRRRAAPAQPR
ncbi:MAG: hypothetical protein JWN39_1326, partial [Ilumatobacteraceae bacterium]|nr:hypothetical protein [Ilumatobacteraceae bacterium]